MRTYFEIMAQEIIPSMRAILAKKLLDNGFSQKQVAERLGLTQPAISQYLRDLRGSRKKMFQDNPQVMELLEGLSQKLAAGQMDANSVMMQMMEICKDYIDIEA